MSDDNKTQEEETPQRSSITNVELGGTKGLLSPLGDPLGNAAKKAEGPVGSKVGGLTQGEGGSKDLVQGASQALGITKTDEQLKEEAQEERIGGKEQTGENPLGL